MLICLLGETKLVLNNKKGSRVRIISISVTVSAIVTISLNYCRGFPRCLNEKTLSLLVGFPCWEYMEKSQFLGVFFSCKIQVFPGLL